MDINFATYLSEYRLKKACEFLQQSEYKISEVSDMVGFKDARYFSTIFKKSFDMTPLEYYLKRKEDSRQELATLIAQANQLIGDTHNSLNTHTNQVSNMGNIKMLSQQLQQLTSRIELEKQKGDMLESICLTLTIEG